MPYLLLVLWRRPGRRRAALAYMAGRWKIALVGTVASLGSYGIALWAMTQAPVAVVAALRETSVLFAAVIGTALPARSLRLAARRRHGGHRRGRDDVAAG